MESPSEGTEDQQLLCSAGGCVDSWFWLEAKDQGPLPGAQKNQQSFQWSHGAKVHITSLLKGLTFMAILPRAHLTNLSPCGKLTKKS